jgi:hypothetical protein
MGGRRLVAATLSRGDVRLCRLAQIPAMEGWHGIRAELPTRVLRERVMLEGCAANRFVPARRPGRSGKLMALPNRGHRSRRCRLGGP